MWRLIVVIGFFSALNYTHNGHSVSVENIHKYGTLSLWNRLAPRAGKKKRKKPMSLIILLEWEVFHCF
jgi:hypothetical protein